MPGPTFCFICQPLLTAQKNTPVLPYSSGKYSPTTTNALTFDKDLFLGDLTATIKFRGPVLKLAGPAADPDSEAYTVEMTTSGCKCEQKFSFGGQKFSEGCTDSGWPVKWCATSKECGYADSESSTGYWDDCVPAGIPLRWSTVVNFNSSACAVLSPVRFAKSVFR